jgi:hypothetical protein
MGNAGASRGESADRVKIVSERYAAPQPSAWIDLTRTEYDEYWDRFDHFFGFRVGMSPEAWPGIREPTPSLTFDLSVIPDGPRRGAAYDVINAEALRCFVWAMADIEELIVLDWQHPAYRFRPTYQALAWHPEWKIPVYPDGDYFAFLSPDFTEGTFGHPWEQTLCVMGQRLIDSLGCSFSTWLPIARVNGTPTG